MRNPAGIRPAQLEVLGADGVDVSEAVRGDAGDAQLSGIHAVYLRFQKALLLKACKQRSSAATVDLQQAGRDFGVGVDLAAPEEFQQDLGFCLRPRLLLGVCHLGGVVLSSVGTSFSYLSFSE